MSSLSALGTPSMNKLETSTHSAHSAEQAQEQADGVENVIAGDG